MNPVTINNWVLRVRIPEKPGRHPVILLIHGWTGNENSMDIFTTRLPLEALLIAPRAPYPAPMGGYSWVADHSRIWSTFDDFNPAIEALLGLLTPIHFPAADFTRMSLVGFSQGTALAYSFALAHPERVSRLAGLSGFLPEGADARLAARPLTGKPIFVAHGLQDELVPVALARRSVQWLQEAGAEVTYCEADVGHKLGTDCFRGLGTFFAK